MYQSIWELPTPVLNSLNEEDATKWLTIYNECNPKSKDEMTEARKKAWHACAKLPSSFSFEIIASTDTIDKAREIIDLESIKKHMDSFIEYGGNIQNDHHNYTVGTIWDWKPCKVKDDRGREVDGILTYGNIYGGDFVYDKIRQSFVKGMNSLSVAGEALPGKYQCDEKGCYTRRKVQQLMEISLCVEPMNKYCTLVDYNKGAEFAKSDSAMNLLIKEYTIHKDQSSCPTMSLKKSLQSIGYSEVHAKEDGVHVPMDTEEFKRTLPKIRANGLVARYSMPEGAAVINRYDDYLKGAFKRSIASGYCESDGAITKRMPRHVFSEYYENGIIGEDGFGWYGFKKSLDDFGAKVGLSPEERRIMKENNQLRYDNLEKMLKDPKKWYLIEDGISTQGYHGFGKDDDEGRRDWLDKTYDRVKESKLRAWRAYYKEHGGRKPPGWLGE